MKNTDLTITSLVMYEDTLTLYFQCKTIIDDKTNETEVRGGALTITKEFNEEEEKFEYNPRIYTQHKKYRPFTDGEKYRFPDELLRMLPLFIAENSKTHYQLKKEEE